LCYSTDKKAVNKSYRLKRRAVLQVAEFSDYGSKPVSGKVYDLEERTRQFAANTFVFVRKIQKDIVNQEIVKQLVRSAGSVGANYIEANEALGDKDFCMKIRICRKEAKESKYWLTLLDIGVSTGSLSEKRELLIKECGELVRIFHAILNRRLVNIKKNMVTSKEL